MTDNVVIFANELFATEATCFYKCAVTMLDYTALIGR